MVNAESVSNVNFMDLSDEEKIEVIQLAKKKDSNACERIIKSYERMALGVAKKHGGLYGNYDMNDVDEVIQAGRIGTMEAIRKFRGGSMGAFTNCVKFNMWSKLNERKGENKPLADGVTCSSIVFENDEGDEVYVTDLLPDQKNTVEDSYTESEMCRTLELAMNGCLNSLERKVVKMHNGIDCEKSSFSEIGEAIGVSKQRAQQINVQAERKIRSCSMREQLMAFVA